MTKTLALAVPRREFHREVQGNSAIAWLVAELLSESCYFLADQLKSMELSESAAQTVARCMVELSAHRATEDGIRARLNLSQETIAQMLGLSRETVSRHLAQFRRAGLLDWNRSGLVIRNRQALEKLADSTFAAA
jgi:CRP-like cAMP-binding protein